MVNAEILEWEATAVGLALNPDRHYGNQCVDLPDQFAQDLTGIPWQQSMGGVQGAKQLLDAAPDEFWIRVDNDPNNPNQLPPRGSILVYGGNPGVNDWGHTAYCRGSDANGCDVLQQDGFAAPLIFVDGGYYSNKPAHYARLPYWGYGTGSLIGWLILREEKIKGYVAPQSNPAVLQAQRVTGPSGVNGRSAAVRTPDNIVQPFGGDLILTFKGYVRGESIDGNNIWFVGAGQGNYFHSSAFTDQSTAGLPDLTPAPAPAPASATILGYQRETGSGGVKLRDSAHKNATIVKTFDPELILDFKGYVIGEDPYGDGNNIWFVGKYSDTYAWSGAFVDSGTHDLPNLTQAAPVVTEKYDFELDFKTLTREDGVVITVEKSPAHITNLQKGNPTADHSEFIVHQFGRLGIDTFESTDAQFETPEVYASAYWSVSGRRVRQHVAMKDRAYHAGTVGNNYLAAETDPAQDLETILTARALIAACRDKEGVKKLELHKNVPGNNTSCGSLIDLSLYTSALVKPAPVIPPVEIPIPEKPPVVTPPASETPGPDHSAEVVSLLQKILDLLTRIFGGSKK